MGRSRVPAVSRIARRTQSLVPRLRARNRWNATHIPAPAITISAFLAGPALAL
jgi:hypothetical protein